MNAGAIGHGWRGDPIGIFNQSMSGDRGSARLESDASGIQMNEFGVGGQVKKFDGLRQQQHPRRRK
jgi:hypothetical protein